MASIRLALIVCAFFFADARNHSHANGTNGSGDPATTSRSEVSVDTTAAPEAPAPSPPGTTQAPAKKKVKGSMTMEGISKETAEELKPKVAEALARLLEFPASAITMGAIEEVTRRLGEERRLNASTTKLKMNYEIEVDESKATALTTAVKTAATAPEELVGAIKAAVANDATLLAKLDNLKVELTVDDTTTAAPAVESTSAAAKTEGPDDKEDSGCDRVRTEVVFASVAVATLATFW